MKLPVQYHRLAPANRARVRKEYVRRQGGKCMHCGESLGSNPPKRITDKKIDWSLFPDGFLNHPVHLQHCHNTGWTEGAVHAYCNAVMWQYERR
jgi:hypothetical protein